MALKLQFSYVDGAALEAIVMDATLSESHGFSAEVTDFPVESGSDKSDNVRPKPVTLRIDAFVSDFPLQSNITQQLAAGAFTQRPSAELRRAQNTLDGLIALKDKGVTITVTTGIRTYKNMVLTQIDVNRDKNIAQGIRMTITMREIQVVKTQTAQIVAKEAKGQNKQEDGHKAKQDASPAENKSLASSSIDAASDFGKKVLGLFQ